MLIGSWRKRREWKKAFNGVRIREGLKKREEGRTCICKSRRRMERKCKEEGT